MKQALDNIKVLDLTRVLAGPYATMILADMGADVIKIEMPKTGDDSRGYGPYVNNESAYFMSINRNKRSMTLNLKSQKGKEIFLEMIKEMDVLVENFRPGTMEKLGLGYDYLSTINPKLIYAAASGYGHTGPYSKRAAYDAVVQAMGGIMSITGEKNGKPTRVGSSIGDISAGMFTAIGILAALESRHSTGRGQKVDVAMLDCQVAMLENAIARYFVTEEVPRPYGNRHTSIVPFETFETSDGEIMVAAGNNNLWAKLCECLEIPELAYDDRFKDNPLRNKNYDELRPLLTSAFKVKTTREWQECLDIEGIPNGPINSIDMVVTDPQVISREMIVEVEHPVVGRFKMPGIPIKLSDTPGIIRTPAPVLGQHTEEILKEYLNYDKNEIQKLAEESVL
ncbi:CoA transferase [Tissierella sp. Yu-01]|uniref:CaiB/BaiF CoA transferase family protein n=1 Tax=Tissierella sp. Yu-01 TaxID=3035694 RepID=UPI00240DD4DB|nr:CoA transferase [Tissierella sp. Yu-01]WFA10106.1 CoA transferase [Tissierella sp. Yu-01]